MTFVDLLYYDLFRHTTLQPKYTMLCFFMTCFNILSCVFYYLFVYILWLVFLHTIWTFPTNFTRTFSHFLIEVCNHFSVWSYVCQYTLHWHAVINTLRTYDVQYINISLYICECVYLLSLSESFSSWMNLSISCCWFLKSNNSICNT